MVLPLHPTLHHSFNSVLSLAPGRHRPPCLHSPQSSFLESKSEHVSGLGRWSDNQVWSFAEAWKGGCREASVWVRSLFWAQWGQRAFYLQVWVGPYWFRSWSRGDTSPLVRVVTRTTGEMEALPFFNHLRGGEGSSQSPPVPSTFFWASTDVCGMIRRHLGMQQGPAALEWG